MLLERIEEKCRERHMSIARLEKEAGLGNATVRGWDKSSPSAANLFKVCTVLNCTMDELLRDGGT